MWLLPFLGSKSSKAAALEVLGSWWALIPGLRDECLFTNRPPPTLSYQAGKRQPATPSNPPLRGFISRADKQQLENGQPARCIQGPVAMATSSTCYAECLLPSRHLRLLGGGVVLNEPHHHTHTHTNPCVMFVSLLTPPLPPFLSLF